MDYRGYTLHEIPPNGQGIVALIALGILDNFDLRSHPVDGADSLHLQIEAVKLVRERGVSAAQAARDLDVHENVLRRWVKEFGSDPAQSFPGHGLMKPEQQEIERLRRRRSRASK